MWETLVAAASTFALFVAANSGDVDLLGDVFNSALIPTVLPFLAFSQSVDNVSDVSSVKRILGAKMDNHGTIAIITIIPIYIRFPASTLTSDELHNLKTARGYESITEENELEHLCPLELYPAPSYAPPNVNNSNAISKDENASNTIARSKGTNGINTDVNAINTNVDHAINTDMNAISKDAINTDVDAINPEASNADQLMVLRQLPAGRKKEKEVLLRLGLAPTYKELSFLRSRNRFQTVVTCLQAAGYMLTALQRALENLGISPVEAFVTFLCITVCVQLLMELYACSNYQRPLLLRLNAHQLRNLYTAMPRDDWDDIAAMNFREGLFWCLMLIYGAGELGLSMYYFVHYVHSHFICALAALLFFLAHVLPAVFLPFMKLCSSGSDILLALYLFMYVSSMILALVSTIVQWEAFHEANQKAWYAWILPHVSS